MTTAPIEPASRKIEIVSHIADIPTAGWQALAGADNPFLDHGFFLALEKSHSATAETGWLGRHYVLRDEKGEIIGILPSYVKGHSQGEYVFDHNWAHAYDRAFAPDHGRYYPKLLSAVPFTPSGTPKLLAQNDDTARILIKAQQQDCINLGLSSAHALFLPPSDLALFKEADYLERRDVQYHWLNDGYASFDAFLSSLSSRKRKTIRRERKDAMQTGIEIEELNGADITEAHWDAFFEFYTDTGTRKWGQPYLTRAFFSMIGETMAEKILLVMARRGERYIGGAINFIGTNTLFGRYWGATEHVPFLHFEVCYYRAIDFAIRNGLSRIEAGAQGEHKVARGYIPVTTHSAHFFPNHGFQDAVSRYLGDEIDAIEDYAREVASRGPYKKA